jgi:hypothetical protein
MKTVKITKDGQYKRLNDQEAHSVVSSNKAKYVPKSEWKNNVRDYKVDRILEKEAKSKP